MSTPERHRRRQPFEAANRSASSPFNSISRHIVIQHVWPEIDGGRYPVKREVRDVLEVWADVFRDGHSLVAAILKVRPWNEEDWTEIPMELYNAGLDRWRAEVRLDRNTRYIYTIEAWTDVFATWQAEIVKKREAGQDVSLELREGREIVAETWARAKGADKRRLKAVLAAFDCGKGPDLPMPESVGAIMTRHAGRADAVRYDRDLEVFVDRVRARYGAWYEMFHRSQGREPGRGASFAECEERLPEIRDMGFDVVYLVPIHPIGEINRKGANNAETAKPGEPGSPYAMGSKLGGHRAVHPDLGTLDDFRHFVAETHRLGMEVALDFAIQCAPDHPWVREHPEWFRFRPDGTIRYAENPPKKYQDIVNVDFDCADREALWQALRDVVLFWVDQGVRIFRVDNPHTKPVPFWEWLIRDVQERHPDVLFLAEAFTRPPMLHMLAKVGFSQSYCYFTWRNTKRELTEYLTELAHTEGREYLRPSFFTNTPDILPLFLQTGGRPAFVIRLVLAATLSPVYGIYNGFELCEAEAVPGREEYLNSEKYQYKVWDWNRPGNIKDIVTRVNEIRRQNTALHELENVSFHPAGDDNVLFYGKMTPDRDNMIFAAVNLDPHTPHETDVEFPLYDMGIPDGVDFLAEDLLGGSRQVWRGARQRLRLDPQTNPAAIFRITRKTRDGRAKKRQ